MCHTCRLYTDLEVYMVFGNLSTANTALKYGLTVVGPEKNGTLIALNTGSNVQDFTRLQWVTLKVGMRK